MPYMYSSDNTVIKPIPPPPSTHPPANPPFYTPSSQPHFPPPSQPPLYTPPTGGPQPTLPTHPIQSTTYLPTNPPLYTPPNQPYPAFLACTPQRWSCACTGCDSWTCVGGTSARCNIDKCTPGIRLPRSLHLRWSVEVPLPLAAVSFLWWLVQRANLILLLI